MAGRAGFAAGIAFAVWGLTAYAQVFRSTVDLVSLGVTVLDKQGRFVTDLLAADFEILEDGRPQAVSYFARGDADPAPDLHLGLLLDASGSMENEIEFSRSAAIKFLNALPHADDITLVDFDTEVRVARYGPNDFPRLVERIRRRKPDGYTAMHDALGVYLDGAVGQEGRKVFVLFTDGMDTGSALRYDEALDLLKAADVTMYAVGLFTSPSAAKGVEQRLRLQQMSETTGGLAFFPSGVKDLDASYDKIVAEIRAQYSIGYLSTNVVTDGSWRKLEVKIKRPGLKTRGRKGYYAPYRKQP